MPLTWLALPFIASVAFCSGEDWGEATRCEGDSVPFAPCECVLLLAESLLTGGGACRTCAAVGPLSGEIPGLREGGVVEPAKTGKSSALGMRC